MFMTLIGCEQKKDSYLYEESYNEYVEPYNEEEIDYYKRLCDEYGYLTYEMVNYPEKWKYYMDGEKNIYHLDWLCSNFNHNQSYFSSASPDYFEEEYAPCNLCKNTEETVYIEQSEKVYHVDKNCLVLNTNDFITPTKNYRMVSEISAIANGYSKCTCNKSKNK
jgi:hypothetical protein